MASLLRPLPGRQFREGASRPSYFWNMAANYGWVAGAAVDPLASTLTEAKAVLVGPGEFRTLDGGARLAQPPVGRGFQAWALKNRSARDGKQRREWRLGTRSGPNASGIYPRTVSNLGATPPGIRKAGSREVMEVRRRPGQVRYQPSVATDSAYQSRFGQVRYQPRARDFRSRPTNRRRSPSTDDPGMGAF